MTSDSSFPHAKFEAARVCGELTLESVWLRYFAVGGRADLLDIDAHLNGIAPLNSYEQDILACALNERLDELYLAFRVPYHSDPSDLERVEDLRDVIAALLDEVPSSHPLLQPPT